MLDNLRQAPYLFEPGSSGKHAMEYVMVGVVVFVLLVVILSARGRDRVVDGLVAEYGRSRSMLGPLGSMEIAKLRKEIKSLESSNSRAALKKLLARYKLTE